MLADHTFDIED